MIYQLSKFCYHFVFVTSSFIWSPKFVISYYEVRLRCFLLRNDPVNIPVRLNLLVHISGRFIEVQKNTEEFISNPFQVSN